MRENRTCGSEGGEAQSLPYPYPSTAKYNLARPFFACNPSSIIQTICAP